jgi:hypothetical protein
MLGMSGRGMEMIGDVGDAVLMLDGKRWLVAAGERVTSLDAHFFLSWLLGCLGWVSFIVCIPGMGAKAQWSTGLFE